MASLFLLLAAALPAQESGQSSHMDHRFDPATYAKAFDNPERDQWQKPEEVIAALDLKPGQAVADIGAGTGYFSIRLARSKAAPAVFAVDIEPSMLDYIQKRAEQEGLRNVRTVEGGERSPNLPEPVDCVLMVNTYHHIADRPGYFRNVGKLLKPGGRVAIIDYRKGGTMGPAREHRFTAEEITAEMAKAGYTLAARPGFLPNQEFLIYRQGEGPK
ncbi:MAG: class I SAM-dependent methyltransferase [Acidobacteria bacterium]|nr:class I SAM-dependent methyltransferase [Acidobacteriota bacterium]